MLCFAGDLAKSFKPTTAAVYALRATPTRVELAENIEKPENEGEGTEQEDDDGEEYEEDGERGGRLEKEVR